MGCNDLAVLRARVHEDVLDKVVSKLISSNFGSKVRLSFLSV